jgi:hypothetical protein
MERKKGLQVPSIAHFPCWMLHRCDNLMQRDSRMAGGGWRIDAPRGNAMPTSLIAVMQVGRSKGLRSKLIY